MLLIVMSVQERLKLQCRFESMTLR